MKSFALGLALKQRRKATRKSPIVRVAPQITAKSPPNAPETQELATTQVSGAGLTILLHFSIFWVQFRIFHTLFSLSLHFVSVRLLWRPYEITKYLFISLATFWFTTTTTFTSL